MEDPILDDGDTQFYLPSRLRNGGIEPLWRRNSGFPPTMASVDFTALSGDGDGTQVKRHHVYAFATKKQRKDTVIFFTTY
ncbi:MAG: hypothetical protein DHS20C04_21120 [Hyphococcus sp.]|nr:MAG: hypothetical protein DHS20C04_21120 [Marinicaulis sp.]